MAPLVLLVGLFLLLVVPLGWQTALRVSLAGMFLLTASAHWGRRRPDLVRMVPRNLPRPELLVTLTGICEILGAIGLLLPLFARWAAIGLTLLLIAVFPANLRAANDRREARDTIARAKLDTGLVPHRDDCGRDCVKWL